MMIVIRHIWPFQDASFAKARKLVTEAKMPETNLLRAARVYESVTGAGNTLAIEWEFDNLSDWEKFREQFFKVPENIEMLRDFPEAKVWMTEIWRKFYQS